MIITRAQWGANITSLPNAAMTLPARQVFIHHSVTPVSDDPARDMRAIEAVGLERFGQFSYSYCVHPRDGEIFEGAGLRRGAHTSQKNSTAFGICWIGDYTTRAPKIQQIDATRWLIADLTSRGHLLPGADILGHRDVYATACPGQKLYDTLDIIRTPWKGIEAMADDPNLPNLPDIMGFYPVINNTVGEATGYYILSKDGQLHAFGPGAKFYGRSEVVEP